jgi:hypothetical protein
VFERSVGYENRDLRKNDVNMDVVWVGRRGRSYRWRDERVVWWLGGEDHSTSVGRLRCGVREDAGRACQKRGKHITVGGYG